MTQDRENAAFLQKAFANRIDFADLDIKTVSLLNRDLVTEAVSLLRSTMATTPWSGEKHLLCSRLLGVLAIQRTITLPTEAQELITEMIEIVTLSREEKSLLMEMFQPLQEKTMPIPLLWKNIPRSFTERITTLPLYENSLRLVNDSSVTDTWLQLEGSRPLLGVYEVDQLVKRIIMNAIMAREGINIYDEFKKYATVLDSDILHTGEIIRNFTIDEHGNFHCELNNFLGGTELHNEIRTHVGSQPVLDDREASAIVGYRHVADGSICIEEVRENDLGLHNTAAENQEKERDDLKYIKATKLNIAHVHTHPSPAFFSFTDISLDSAVGIEGDIGTYLAMNKRYCTDSQSGEHSSSYVDEIAGIVLVGYNTGFLYEPSRGVRVVRLQD